MSKSPKSPKSPDISKKPFPKEVEMKQEGQTIVATSENDEKLLELAKVIKKNQESVQVLKLELTEKDRIIKEIMDKLDALKIRRPPIRPPHYYSSKIEENPYLEDDLDYWQINSTRPAPMPRSWISQIELDDNKEEKTDEKKEVKLPKIMTKQNQYRSSSTSKSKLYTKQARSKL